MEGSPPLNADSILERMASPVGGQPPPMEPVNPHQCYHPPPHEDPAFHVERFEEILISNLITRPEYYLIWFPNTLVEGAYAWYQSNATGSF
jgi:hypothetical protein